MARPDWLNRELESRRSSLAAGRAVRAADQVALRSDVKSVRDAVIARKKTEIEGRNPKDAPPRKRVSR